MSVRDWHGASLPGMRVLLEDDRAARVDLTGPDGEASFEDVPPGDYRLVVSVPDATAWVAPRPLKLAEAATRRLELVVRPRASSIAGRVNDADGRPVAGIRVRARSFVQDAGDAELVPADETQQEAESGGDGRYAIDGLAPGDYLVATLATKAYASSRRVVRSGVTDADLVLLAPRPMRVGGCVRGPDRHPIADVSVHVFGMEHRGTATTEDGRYEITVDLQPGGPERRLVFRRLGYLTKHRQVEAPRHTVGDDLTLDVVLEESHGFAPFAGRVVGPSGTGIEGQNVFLHSVALRRHYKAVTDGDGRFFLSYVEVGGDYLVLVRSVRQGWRDFEAAGLEVPEDGVEEFRIALEPLRTGRVRGRVATVCGEAAAGVRILLRSAYAVLRPEYATTDAHGSFDAEAVPEGPLTLASPAWPRFLATGLTVRAEAEVVAQVILDDGEHTLSGEILDASGQAVPGAEIRLASTHARGDAKTRTLRTGTSDARGWFTFTGLGDGSLRLFVYARGYRKLELSPDPGNAARHVRVVLQPE